MKKPTLLDVAQSAGVSITTASLVLSGKGRISESVRNTVLLTADQLGYGKKQTPFIGAKNPIVGILVNIDPVWAFIWNFIRPLIAEIEKTLTLKGFSTVLIPIYESMPPELLLQRIINEGCKGIFTLHYVEETIFYKLESQGIPVIVIMNGNFQDKFNSILVDDFQGAYEGTRHLIKLGHRDIIYVGTERIDLPKLTTDRYYGFCKALEESGINLDLKCNLNWDTSNTPFLEASLREIFLKKPRPTAIFAIDDDMAIRIISLLKPMGIQVPEELSVIAPGDILNYADPFITPITTLKINTNLMGKLACDMMFRRLSGEDTEVHVLKIKQQLVQRGSTKPIALKHHRIGLNGFGNPKERVLGTFSHRPDLLPARWLGASREFITKACIELNMDEEQFRRRIGDDLRWMDIDAMGQGGRRFDAFGIERKGSGYGQPLNHPLQEEITLEKLDNYPWPVAEQYDISSLRERIEPISNNFAIVGGSWSPFWHDAVDLVGMESLACLMYDNPVFTETLLNRIVDYYISLNTRIFEEAGDLIDILFIRNDFGTQIGPLISTEHFERFISPCIKRLVDTAHRYNIKVMLHSSGGIRPLIPSIIKTGIDALHALQPDCPGMQAFSIKKEFGGSLVLSGGIDARGVLLRGSPIEVKNHVISILNIYAKGGGYLAAPSVDAITEDIPVKNILAMFDAINEWRGS